MAGEGADHGIIKVLALYIVVSLCLAVSDAKTGRSPRFFIGCKKITGLTHGQ